MQLGSTPRTGSDGPRKRETPPAGLHLGILFRIVSAGWCQNEYKGEVKVRTEARLDFELWPLDPKTNQYITMEDGRPFCVSPGFQGWLTFKKMGEYLESWKGSPVIDSELILGQAALINIQHKPYTNKMGEACIAVNVMGILPLMPGMVAPEMANPPMVYDVQHHDQELFDKLPKWIAQHIIDKSEDWKKLGILGQTGVTPHAPAPRQRFDGTPMGSPAGEVDPRDIPAGDEPNIPF